MILSKNTFTLLGLDKDFGVAGIIKYTNLQWRRKYLESGTFAVEIPLGQYDKSYKYIYCKDRPEVGVIEQVNYKVGANGYHYIYLSGHFLESWLNRMVCYPKGESNIVNAPTFATKTGHVEDVATFFFDQFKQVSDGTRTARLNILTGRSLGRGRTVTCERGVGSYLGDRIFDILSLDDMSYRINYDFVENIRTFEVWKGRDLTLYNAEGNNPVTFSTRYGNCKNPDVLVSQVSYKNASMTINDATLREDGSTETIQKTYMRALWNRTGQESVYDDRFTIYKPELNLSEYKKNESDKNGDLGLFLAAIQADGENDLRTNHPTTINIDFDCIPGSYEYRADFDIGDLCGIEIPEIDLSANARLIGCYEVMKSGGWTLKLEFGTPVLI